MVRVLVYIICLRYLLPGIWEPFTLMDIQMKFMDGMTAVRKIREMLIDCNVSLRLFAWSDCGCKKADIGLNNLIHIKRDFCVKIVMKNVRKLQIKAYKT